MKGSNSSLKCNFAYSMMFQIFTMITPFVTAPYVSRVLYQMELEYKVIPDQYNPIFFCLQRWELQVMEIEKYRKPEIIKKHIARSFMKLS